MENDTNNITGEKKNLYLEYALFLILGFLLGIVIKTEAAKRITVGFDDYQVDTGKQIYNLNEIQRKLKAESIGLESDENAVESEGAEDVEPEEPGGTEDQETEY